MNKWLFHQNGFTRTSLSATVTRVSNFVEENVCLFDFYIVKAPVQKPQGGGGGRPTLIFSAYVGSDPASTIHPKKISGISSTLKKYLEF